VIFIGRETRPVLIQRLGWPLCSYCLGISATQCYPQSTSNTTSCTLQQQSCCALHQRDHSCYKLAIL